MGGETVTFQIPAWVVAIAAWVVSLLQPAEWSAAGLLVVATLSGTHTIKVAWRLAPIPGGGNGGAINLVASAVGFACAWVLWPAGGHAPWYVAGVIAGPAAIVAFKLCYAVIGAYFPKLASALNFDRRRTERPLPPVGIPERRRAR